jgi:putative ABC transport system substrate-binding protein
VRRRAFITLVGGAAVARSVAARALRAQERVWRVGVLMGNGEGDAEARNRVVVLRRTLQELGWSEGRNVVFDIRFATADAELRRRYATEMVAGAPDVIVANTAPVATEVQRATTTIPIVYAAGADPVVAGLVANLAHPGGNLTGFSVTEPSLGGKWLDMLKELAPSARRAGIVLDPANMAGEQYLHSIEAANARYPVALTQLRVRDDAGIVSAIDAFAHSGGDGALLVLPGAATGVHRASIIAAAARNRLPTIYPTRFYATDGGLASYGGDYADIFRRTATYVDRILRGEKAGDLPIQESTKFELVINLKTAKALGLTVPPTLLARADEVIE